LQEKQGMMVRHVLQKGVMQSWSPLASILMIAVGENPEKRSKKEANGSNTP